MIKYSQIQEIAVVYGQKELIMEFLEKFETDRKHDGAEQIKATLLNNEMKKELKRFIWKGD